MEIFQLRIFQQQVLDQCKFVTFAAQDIDAALQFGDIDRIFYSVQNVLTAGANISKMLWGQGGGKADERKPLRDSINVQDDSILRKVSMRNHFEHMDERIDRWWHQSTQKNYVDKNLGPRNTIGGADPNDIFRWFDPSTADIVFWGDGFNIQALATEATRLIPKLEEEANKPHWEQHIPKL